MKLLHRGGERICPQCNKERQATRCIECDVKTVPARVCDWCRRKIDRVYRTKIYRLIFFKLPLKHYWYVPQLRKYCFDCYLINDHGLQHFTCQHCQGKFYMKFDMLFNHGDVNKELICPWCGKEFLGDDA